MDYFRILNLKKEPFSNSPEPEFFFQSVKHIGCLQKVELAVRLRRGLSVVVGDVGTGKTTLCRQLILKFASSEEDRNQFETHLILDPSFTNPLEFLSTVAMTFGVSEKELNVSEWRLKENIKNYLFQKGVDEGKIVVLIIDEGQKLPDFCLEILREFLNYETNECKLLQIIIFAQREFEEIMDRQKNFVDRVNFYYILEPLNFKETRGMVEFRIEKASDAEKAPSLFTYLGLWALYLSTKGYPRKVVTLCHQIILALIIQNKPKAGWFLARSCAQRAPAVNRRSFKWAAVTVLVVFFVILAVVGFYPDLIQKNLSGSAPSIITKDRESVVPAQTVLRESGQSAKLPIADATAKTRDDKPVLKKVPDFLGTVKLKRGRTVWRMLNDFYGDFDVQQLKAVALANPSIKNLNRVSAGEAITLPAMQTKSNQFPQGKYWVKLANSRNIDEIYDLYKKYEDTVPSLRFLPYWNTCEGLVFAIFLKDGYSDREAALNAVKNIPQILSSNSRVFTHLDNDTVFFRR